VIRVRYVIVGVDPGTTAGLAILDMRGNLLHISSKKGADDFWIFQTIRSYGVPIIVATDKSSIPSRVRKISARFGAKLRAPKEDVRVSVKDEIAHRFSCCGDDHQRDALAAAFFAFQSFAHKFRQIEKRVGGDREKEEFVKRAVVFGQSADRALHEYGQTLEKHVQLPKRTVRRRENTSDLLKRIAELREELRRKDELIDVLKDRIAGLERENEELLKNARGLPVSEEVEKLRMQRNEARRRAERLARRIRALERTIDGIASGKYIVVDRRSAEGRAVFQTEFAAVVKPPEEDVEEDVARNILRIIEEYRRGRT